MNTFSQDMALSKQIARGVRDAGGRAYYVGGFVRDALMGRECKDIDIEVYGIAPQRLREVLSQCGEVYDRGASFGVLGLLHSNIDIAMPRTESCRGKKHIDFDVSVNPFLDPKEACKRRDFSINAMLMDVLSGEVLDFYGGRDDLKAGLIRCVNAQTFIEDALRVFRAAQFAARFGAKIEAETMRLCETMDVSALSRERVLAETEKALLKADKPSVYFRMLKDMNHLKEFYPEIEKMGDVPENPLFHPEGDVFEHTMLVLDSAAALRDRSEWPLGFMLSALIHDVGKCVATQVQPSGKITAYGHEVLGLDMAERQLRRLTDNDKLIRYVRNMTRLHMRPNMLAGSNSKKKKTRRLFDESLSPNDLILLSRADATGMLSAPYDEHNEAWLRERLKDYRSCIGRPMVTGKDLIEAGFTPGADFSKLLARARQLHFAGLEKKNALRQLIGEYKMNDIHSK